MYAMRYVAAVVTLLLVGSVALARGDDKVLVPGDPPLTQEVVDNCRRMAEWALSIELGDKERRQWEQFFVVEFLKKDQAKRKASMTVYQGFGPYLDKVSKMPDAERVRERARKRDFWLDSLRKSSDRDDRMLLGAYDEAYKPGGSKNPILVKSDPPLTQGMIDLDAATAEVLLDLRLSDEQRKKFRDLRIEDWKSWDAAKRLRDAKNTESWANLPTFSNYRRNEQRALTQPRLLTEFHKKDSGELAQWLLTLHESTIKPGSERNPVLVDGVPQLTQLMVDRYIDYVEIMLDMSIGGGFTTPQRQVLQDYLVKDWKKLSADDRKELLGDINRWEDAAAMGADEANKCIGALRPKLLAQLRTAREDARSQWLLVVFDGERELLQARLQVIKQVGELKRDIARAMEPKGHWEFNLNTRRHDWVADR
jgi:hypothetical protein